MLSHAVVRRSLLVLVALLGLILPVASPAAATVRYCRADPIILVGGYLVDVQVGVPFDKVDDIENRTVDIQVIVPEGVEGGLVLADNLFFNQRVHFTHRGTKQGNDIPVEVVVTVPSRERFTVYSYATYSGIKTQTVSGLSNTPISSRFVINTLLPILL